MENDNRKRLVGLVRKSLGLPNNLSSSCFETADSALTASTPCHSNRAAAVTEPSPNECCGTNTPTPASRADVTARP